MAKIFVEQRKVERLGQEFPLSSMLQIIIDAANGLNMPSKNRSTWAGAGHLPRHLSTKYHHNL